MALAPSEKSSGPLQVGHSVETTTWLMTTSSRKSGGVARRR
jgi:hypothetical protein